VDGELVTETGPNRVLIMHISKREKLASLIDQVGLLWALKWLARRPGLLVLAYHRIGEAAGQRFNDGLFSTTAEGFRQQLLYLRSRFGVISLDELLASVEGRGFVFRRPTAMITFDDGYRDNYEKAFPILKRHSERIALGYLVTRAFDGVGIAISGTLALSLIALSQETIQAGTQVVADSVTLANLLVASSDTAYIVTMLALGLGSMPFCYLLYRSRLIPRPLAALGFVGYAALFAGSLLEIVGMDLRMIHYVPGGLFEILLPVRLIFWGFDVTATSSHSAEPDMATDRVSVSPTPADQVA
jgi:hypothetical protein